MRAGSEGSGEGEGLSSLRAFAHSSSLHGISHVFAYGAVSLRRVLWGAFFLGSLGLLLLVCAERVAYFLTYPHVTKLDEVAAHNLTFPAITICNLNEFRFSKITRNDMYHVGELLALLNDRYEISNPQLAEPHVLAALRDKANFKNFKAKPFSMAEFYNRTGHDLADMLLQCSFRGANCTARNFTVVSAGPGARCLAGGGGSARVGVATCRRGPQTDAGVLPGSGTGALGLLRHRWVSPFSRPMAVPPVHPTARSTSAPAHLPGHCGRPAASQVCPHPTLAAGVPGGWEQCPGWSCAVPGALCRAGRLCLCAAARVRDAGGYSTLAGTGCWRVWPMALLPLRRPQMPPGHQQQQPLPPGCVCTQTPTPAAPLRSLPRHGWGSPSPHGRLAPVPPQHPLPLLGLRPLCSQPRGITVAHVLPPRLPRPGGVPAGPHGAELWAHPPGDVQGAGSCQSVAGGSRAATPGPVRPTWGSACPGRTGRGTGRAGRGGGTGRTGTSFVLRQRRGSSVLSGAGQPVPAVRGSAQTPSPSPRAQLRYHSSNYRQLKTLSARN